MRLQSVNIPLIRLRLTGDVVFATPLIRADRRRHPDARLATESIPRMALPCRPCDRRRCEPGDFRRLGSFERALVARAAGCVLAGQGRD